MLVSLFVSLLCVACTAAPRYEVTFRRYQRQHQPVVPVVSSLLGESDFKWNYNAAALAYGKGDSKLALLVRCQDQKSPNDKWSTTSSVIAWSELVAPFTFSKVTNDSVVFRPQEPYENYGTEDPRVTQKDGVYYLLYSAVYQNSTGVLSQLALATTTAPWNASAWTRHGPLFPKNGWSKSGAMLIRDEPPHYLFFGDSSFHDGLQIATSNDLLSWDLQPGTMLPMRPKKFDSSLVEAGPMPLPLSDGNYLFIYNSAQKGFPSSKPGWDMKYNVGYAILNGKNPVEVLERSEDPLLSPELGWEEGTGDNLSLTPNVVFLEGWQPIDKDTFLVFYGGADSVIGAGEISVKIHQ